METLFIGNDPRLEAVREGTAGRCAVVTHPHPLYGGDMHNNVVMAARDAALAAGFSSLRFNFRGVGRSDGFYDHGQGEREDLKSVLSAAGENPILLAYSFGAWVASGILASESLPAILISPPTGMMTFSALKGLNVWAIVGNHDQFCDPNKLQEVIDLERIQVVPGIDHFWFGQEKKLETCLAPILRTL